MESIEPIYFEWEGSGIETDDQYQNRFREWTWDITSDFIFHKSASEVAEEISPFTLEEKYEEVVDTETETIRDVLPLADQQISMGTVSRRGINDTVYYVRGDSVIVPANRVDGLARIVSDNKNAARDLVAKLSNQIERFCNQLSGAGIESVSVYTGEEFTLENITHHEATIVVEKDADDETNEFERQVIEELQPLSQAFVNNVRVRFPDYPPDEEFDVLFSSGPNGLLQVEVKDYSGMDDNPGLEESIHRPLRKASLLDVDQTFTVLRGVDDSHMDQLRKNSEVRKNIQVVDKSELVDKILPLLENVVGRSPGFYSQR